MKQLHHLCFTHPSTAPTQGDVPLLDPGTAVAYLQLAVPSLRISKLLGTYVGKRGIDMDSHAVHFGRERVRSTSVLLTD